MAGNFSGAAPEREFPMLNQDTLVLRTRIIDLYQESKLTMAQVAAVLNVPEKFVRLALRHPYVPEPKPREDAKTYTVFEQ